MVNRPFWQGKRVFITGHTGFKGGWLATWLMDMGAETAGFALASDTDPSYFRLCGLSGQMPSVLGDLRDLPHLCDALKEHRPEIVFHLAAQAIVRRSYLSPVETFATNVMGTLHLLEAIRQTPSVRAVVVVTSDKCYENRGVAQGYREGDPMGGADPYSASKGCAELVTAAYRQSFFKKEAASPLVATARAGNVIGGGDWGEDRLVPDAMRSLPYGKPWMIRNPHFVRPWQHVLDPLSGYLMLAERLFHPGNEWACGWNFGPPADQAVTVTALAERVLQHWGSGKIEIVPNETAPHEAKTLLLDSTQARQQLGWHPCLRLNESVQMTMAWYREAVSTSSGSNMLAVSLRQIRDYEERFR